MTTRESPGVRPPQRVKRPEPARTGSVRGGWLGLFSAPGVAPVPGAEQVRRQQDAQESERSPDPMARAVELGYRVVDDYIRQGQNAARLIEGGAYGPQAARQDAQEVALRFFQYASEIMGMWFDVLGVAATTQSAAPRSAASGDPADGPAAAASAAGSGTRARVDAARSRPRVSVFLDATRPVEVRADLRPPPAGSVLQVHELRSTSASLPNVRDVAIECDEEGAEVTVRVCVPRDQPPGVYRGVVVDLKTHVPLGTIELRIPAAGADR
jgi:hypothetical protein